MSEQPLRVLLVDDDADLREPLAKYLQQTCGYQVDTAAYSGSALAMAIRQTPYDVVLINYFLMPAPDQEPEPSGIQLLTAIKAHCPQTECILFTGLDTDVGLEALRTGAFHSIRKPFKHLELGAMIEHAVEHRRLKGEAREKEILAQLMATSAALLGERNLQEILKVILRGVQALGFDRVRLYLLSADGQFLEGHAHLGMDSAFTQLKIPVQGDRYLQKLLNHPRPQVFARKVGKPVPYEQALAKEDVNQWACVPLLFQGKVIGKLSVDNKFTQRQLVEAELGPLALFATQAAAAIENARLMAAAQTATLQATQYARHLAAIQEVSRVITSLVEPEAVLQAACKAVVELFAVDHSGLVHFAENYEQGHVVAEYPDSGAKGLRILVRGVPAEERLINAQEPIVLTDIAQAEALGDVREVLLGLGIRSILVVPVVSKGRVLASFSLDVTRQPRSFTLEEVELCKIFAAQVAAALENAELFAAAQRRATQLEKLRHSSLAITSQLDRNKLLKVIIEQAVAFLSATGGCIYEYDAERALLRAVADYGLPADLQGHTLAMGEGMAGKLVQTKQPFMSVEDYEQWPGKASVYAGKVSFGAVIDVLLQWQERIVGVLCINDTVGRKFTESDARLLQLFADQAAIALNNAKLVAQLAEQKDLQARLIASAPAGVIAIDRQGRVTSYNAQAQKILKYQPDEVLGQSVASLYDDGEAYRVGRLLEQATDGQLTDFLTFVRSKAGERIPIRLSATWMYDTQGQPSGSVGYFEDRRTLLEVEKRLHLLVQASNIVAQAETLKDGLQRLAELLVTFLGVSFGGVELLDDSGQFLVVEAAASMQDEPLAWNPRLGERTAVKDWAGLAEFLAQSTPFILRTSEIRNQPRLTDISRQYQLTENIQSMLFIPLRTRQRTLGLLFLGELRPWSQAPLSQAKIDFATAIANQTSVLIDRIRMHERTERRRQWLAALNETSQHIRAEKEPAKLLQEVVRLAAELVNCPVGGLYTYRPHIREMELQAIYGLPETLSDAMRIQLETVSRQVAQTGQPKAWHQPVNPVGDKEAETIHLIVAIPLKQSGEIEAVLFVADHITVRSFTAFDQEILERFAGQAAIALQTSYLLGKEQRALAKLAILHQISDYIQAAVDLDKILHVVLTGVTAGYGLGFNRAALFLLDERSEQLVGRMGIGHLDEALAQEDWMHDQQNGVYDFRHYLALMEQGALRPTPVDICIRELCLPLKSLKPDIFSQSVLQKRYMHVLPTDFANLPGRFNEAFEPALPLIVVPLIARGQVIGLLVADNKFTRNPITSEDTELLLTFANTAAIAISNTQLFHDIRIAHKRLRTFYAASNTLVSSQDPNQVLRDIVEQARLTAEAERASVILLDEIGQIRDLVVAGTDQPTNSTELIRSDGYSMQVMHSGQPVVIDDTRKRTGINPSEFWSGVAAGCCLPMLLQGRQIGVMWFHYYKPRHISTGDVEAAQLYANQAALAYAGARRMAELEHLHRAAEAITGMASVQQTLEQIAHSARIVLKADSAVIYSYDAVRRKFDEDISVSSGIVQNAWSELKKITPRLGGTADTVMERGWVGITDINDLHKYNFLGINTRRMLEVIGARSFQGIALRVGDEKLGVLYVNYNRYRSFSLEEQGTAKAFANYAALALKKVKLLEQVSKARNTARVVAKVATLGDLDRTLNLVVSGTKEVLDCDAVTLYVYYHDEDKLSHPPAMTGVIYPDKAQRFAGVASDSIVFAMLQRDHIYIMEEIATDPLFKDTRFAQEEKIISCLAIPLKVGDQRVGVMFINYRTQHRFTDDELASIELFANQAAVAIHNAQIYQQATRRLKESNALGQVALSLAGTSELQQVLNVVMAEAMKLTDTHEGHVLIWDAQHEKFVQALRTHADGLLKPYDSAVRTEGGFTRTIINERKPVVIDNLQTHPHANPVFNAKGYQAVVGVPLLNQGDVIGVLYVSSKESRQFPKHQVNLLMTMASHVAVAIHRATQYEELKRTKVQMNARTRLAWMGMANNTWRHSIEKHALTIYEQIQLLRQDLHKVGLSQNIKRLVERLDMMERLAKQISEKPVNPVLSAEEGLELVALNRLVADRVVQLWRNDPYRTIPHRLDLQLSDSVTVRANPEWLQRALDNVVENALNAVTGHKLQEIKISTRTGAFRAEIWVSDTGSGISEDVKIKLGLDFIEKPEDAKGLGMGLLLAQTIIQTYGGQIWVEVTGTTGTTMVIGLPAEILESDKSL